MYGVVKALTKPLKQPVWLSANIGIERIEFIIERHKCITS